MGGACVTAERRAVGTARLGGRKSWGHLAASASRKRVEGRTENPGQAPPPRFSADPDPLPPLSGSGSGVGTDPMSDKGKSGVVIGKINDKRPLVTGSGVP